MAAPDYFDFFGIERKLNLDPDVLQRRFYQLSRELHPDRFTRASAEERERALQHSATLNDAYRVLRDPVLRAQYVLTSGGLQAGEVRSVPPELLEDVFELNEALASGDRGAVEGARSRVSGMRETAQADMEALFSRHDSGEDILPLLRAVVNRRRYIDNLMCQVEGALAHV